MAVKHYFFKTTDSTQAEARKLLAAGQAAPFLVTAAQQSAGQGRLGRAWISPPGNFYGSLVWRAGVPPARYGEYSFVAAVALRETIEQFSLLPRGRRWHEVPDEGEARKFSNFSIKKSVNSPSPPASPDPLPQGRGETIILSLKWPNDVLLAGRKCAGILIESHDEFLIIGIGVNLRHAPPDDAVRTPAAALWPDTAIDSDRDTKFMAALTDNFTLWDEKYLQHGFEPIRVEWLRHAHNLNQHITVTTPTETHSGIFNGIDEYGNLLLTQGPRTRKITTADVS